MVKKRMLFFAVAALLALSLIHILGLEGFDRRSLLRRHLMHHIIGTPTFMYKKQALLQVGGFDDAKVSQESVSYTHLDVYKRQEESF